MQTRRAQKKQKKSDGITIATGSIRRLIISESDACLTIYWY